MAESSVAPRGPGLPRLPRRLGRLAVVVVATAALVASCTSSDRGPKPDPSSTTAAPSTTGPGLPGGLPARTPLVDYPERDRGAPAQLPTQLGPLVVPAKVAPARSGMGDQPVPTNQWWSSLATEQPSRVWLHPLAVEFRASGLEIAAPTPVASADEIVSDWAPFARMRTTGNAKVIGYGDFSVTVEHSTPSGAQVTATLAQGLPAISLRTTPGVLEFELLAPPGTLTTREGRAIGTNGAATSDALTATNGDRAWDLRTDRAVSWRRDGQTLRVEITAPTVLTLARPPVGVGAAWGALIDNLARHPVISTSSSALVTAGSVTHTLRWERSVDVATPAVLLPHQKASVAGATQVLGTYPSVRGELTLVAASEVSLAVPLPGVVLGPVPLDPTGVNIAELLELDLRDVSVRAGSYFGARDLGRLVSVVDALESYGPPAEHVATRDRLLRIIADDLRNRMVYSGAGDDRYLSYEPSWGGIVAAPPEFGSEHHNDHHFHYGYLFSATALIAEHGLAEPSVVAAVDALAASLLSRGVRDVNASARSGGGFVLGSGGVFNPWLGHSLADGFALSNRGNNQESSSEAVHAWYGMARWARATDRTVLGDQALARYAIESAAARTYWLGEGGSRPAGYAHETVGIVWDDRFEFRTFFSADVRAVIGIQLLPFTYGSLYRFNGEAALRRSSALFDPARLWPDVLVFDVALGDPARARGMLDALVARVKAGGATDLQGGTSFLFTRVWIDTLGRYGLPDAATAVSPPIGQAFVAADGRRSLLAANPSSVAVNVTVSRAGRPPVTVAVPARGGVVTSL